MKRLLSILLLFCSIAAFSADPVKVQPINMTATAKAQYKAALQIMTQAEADARYPLSTNIVDGSWYSNAEVEGRLRSMVDSLLTGTYVKGDSTIKLTYVATSTAPALTWSSAGLLDNLVYSVDLEEALGTTFANSIAGKSAVTGTNVTANQTGIVGKSVSIASNGTMADVAATSDLYNHDVTMSYWIYPTTLTSCELPALYTPDALDSYIVTKLTASGGITADVANSDNGGANAQVTATAGNYITAGQWNNVTVVFDRANIKIYINGTIRVTQACTYATSSFLNQKMYSPGSAGYSGKLDLLNVWSKALTQTDVTNLNSLGNAGKHINQ